MPPFFPPPDKFQSFLSLILFLGVVPPPLSTCLPFHRRETPSLILFSDERTAGLLSRAGPPLFVANLLI